jgi:hypothetical protein
MSTANLLSDGNAVAHCIRPKRLRHLVGSVYACYQFLLTGGHVFDVFGPKPPVGQLSGMRRKAGQSHCNFNKWAHTLSSRSS